MPLDKSQSASHFKITSYISLLEKHEILILFTETESAYLHCAMISTGTNAHPQTARLMPFSWFHWLIQNTVSYVKLSPFETKVFMNQQQFHFH